MAKADIKQAVTTLAPTRTKLQLVKATAHHLRSVQRQPERIRKYSSMAPFSMQLLQVHLCRINRMA
jgi:hypothetical protein